MSVTILAATTFVVFCWNSVNVSDLPAASTFNSFDGVSGDGTSSAASTETVGGIEAVENGSTIHPPNPFSGATDSSAAIIQNCETA